MAFQPNLVVPTVLWGQHAPTHCPSCVTVSKDLKTIATGSLDGQIIIWEMDPKILKMTPRLMLMGHSAPVVCLTSATPGKDMNTLVSSAENGELCVWDMQGGRCVEHTKSSNVHLNFTGYYVPESDDYRLLTCGYYPGVQIINPMTLQVLYNLSSRISADWISALTLVRTPGKSEDVVIGVTTTGAIKTWHLNGKESVNGEPYYESESRQLRCYNALRIVCCQYNPRVLLMVCSKFWQVYDTSDFSLLVSTLSPVGERLLSGEFLTTEKILMWTDAGKGYLYWLPPQSVAESKDFRTQRPNGEEAFPFCQLSFSDDEPHFCPPTFVSAVMPERGQLQRYLIRADCSGRLSVWSVPEVSAKEISQLKQERFDSLPGAEPISSLSLQEAWDKAFPPPPGILDQIERDPEHPGQKVTCSLFLPSQGRLVCGMNNGQIVIVPATHTIMLHLLTGRHQGIDGWPIHKVLMGHAGKVTCLVYPNSQHPRYDVSYLVSGSADFCVFLWDLYTGTLLHRFCVQGGEITQLLVPPPGCSPRILQCVCSVASDHSVALLSVKERRSVMLASRHIFPVVTVKWRPVADYMVVACADGSVSIWEMETTNLERILQGTLAEDVLTACEEGSGTDASVGGGGTSSAPGGSGASEMGMANPAVHFFRGLRHRNVAAMRHAAQRGLDRLHGQSAQVQDSVDMSVLKNCMPLSIQGLRTNMGDSLSHVLFFHIEALIVNLMSDEYGSMPPASLESLGLIHRSEYQALETLTHSANLDTQMKLADFLGKVKDTAENMEKKLKEKEKEMKPAAKDLQGFLVKVKESAESVQQKIQAKVESVGLTAASVQQQQAESPVPGRKVVGPSMERETASLASLGFTQSVQETRSFAMEVAQLLLSLLHGWGLDADLDKVCLAKLGLLRPMVPISFGLLSRGGYMSLFMPTWFPPVVQPTEVPENLSMKEYSAKLAAKTELFTAKGRWELAPAITTHHLLSIISISNTLMSMSNATFVSEVERKKKLLKQASTLRDQSNPAENLADEEANARNQVKQGWSLLTTLHCILLPDIVDGKYKRVHVEMLARRWQDRCLEVREAAQALLLAELNRIGPKGRKALVEAWAPFLPTFSEQPAQPQQVQTAAYTHGAPQYTGHHGQQTHPNHRGSVTSQLSANGNETRQGISRSASPLPAQGAVQQTAETKMKDGEEGSGSDSEEEEVIGDTAKKGSMLSMAEMKRKQTTSIVLMGVIGAEFGQEMEPNRRKDEGTLYPANFSNNDGSKHVQDGFGIAQTLARQTTQALSYLLLAPPSPGLPPYSALRRSAVDLIGRGFSVWEPHLEVSKVLLGLLELCAADSDKLAPSMDYGLPLTPVADMCRTARHALGLVGTARPQVFITTLAREVARYNTLQQNAQTLNVNLSASVLARAKPDMLRALAKLFESRQQEVINLMVEVMDIVLHCIDHGHLRAKSLPEVFPPICRFPMVAHCLQTKRIAVGAQNGQLALYEIKGSNKCQNIPAHVAGITAVAFSHDGKFLATYSQTEARLSFWQTSSGMFGLGNAQTRCVKSFSTAPVPDVVRMNPLRTARLVWINSRTVALMMPDGSESRFSV